MWDEIYDTLTDFWNRELDRLETVDKIIDIYEKYIKQNEQK